MRDPAAIQSDLDFMRVSLRSAVVQSYSLDTGQGKQSVTRSSINDLQAAIRNLENELEDATGSGGNFTATLERY